jgi:hypothetical protein
VKTNYLRQKTAFCANQITAKLVSTCIDDENLHGQDMRLQESKGNQAQGGLGFDAVAACAPN